MVPALLACLIFWGVVIFCKVILDIIAHDRQRRRHSSNGLRGIRNKRNMRYNRG